MVITHTQDKHGNVRLYLGGNASIECWIEPASDGTAWSFHTSEGVTSYGLAPDQQRACAAHLLAQLCKRLGVSPVDLTTVPFETIATLHDANPFDSRRVATPKRTARQHAYVATPPHVTRPTADFHKDDVDPQFMRHRT